MKTVKITILFFSILALFSTSCSFNNSSSSSQSSPSSTTSETKASKQPVVVFGDMREGDSVHQKIVNAIVKLKPEAVFLTGDLVNNGLIAEQWKKFNRIEKPLTKIAKLYPALGNHENNSSLYFDNFKLPNNERWYSVDVNPIHFIVLDSTTNLQTGSEQYQWLKGDLKNHLEAQFTAVVLHHPLLTVGRHQALSKGKDALTALFEKYGVDIVFAGHNHDYERSYYHHIYYIVTGGGGAPLYDQRTTSTYNQVFQKSYNFCVLNAGGEWLAVEVFNENSKLIDKFKTKGI